MGSNSTYSFIFLKKVAVRKKIIFLIFTHHDHLLVFNHIHIAKRYFINRKLKMNFLADFHMTSHIIVRIQHFRTVFTFKFNLFSVGNVKMLSEFLISSIGIVTFLTLKFSFMNSESIRNFHSLLAFDFFMVLAGTWTTISFPMMF